tara:strand:- start:3890 stop:4147 length:258 start_codon:yes stop_codon:yes gene_type:complete
MLYTDYLLSTDTLGAGALLDSSHDQSPKDLVLYARKMLKFSERNLDIIKTRRKAVEAMYQRQLKNATYWGMALDLAKEELKGGLQ